MLFAATSILVGRSIISCQYLPSQLFIHVLKNGQIQAFFVYFCPFLITISIIQIEKKRRWCAWDLKPRPQDGSRRRNHGAMAAARHVILGTLLINAYSLLVD